ncbi:hypothetical protein PYW07_016440 [Mythimna separata]|uniref:FLYWCH-type domain-containing protein n=1 Tax=Mythimna separata TaxID=271217 RepID=A0AAD7YKI7_MYTSE|nr:hypothetical protein PYW07_016440 [Mythimna separata]
MIEDHTFSQAKKDIRYWHCSKRTTKGCKAKIQFDNYQNVTAYVRDHNHSPPPYAVGFDGTMIRLPPKLTITNEDQDLKKEQYEQLEQLDYEEEEITDQSNIALFVESRRGKTVLQYNGHRYRKAYKSRNGTRWNCSLNKNCAAFIFLNDQDEILMSHEEHDHPQPARLENIDTDQNDTAVVITSRKGKEMLLFRKFTYRKQYDKGNKSRWICSTLKNCRGCVFTDSNNYIISAFEEHCHDPPKYYLKPDHVLGALREPLIIETD